MIGGAGGASGLRFGEAFRNRRFRWVLLALASPTCILHLWQTLALKLAFPYAPRDFLVYLEAGRRMAAGKDPYASLLASRFQDVTLSGGFEYPPLAAWLLQPLSGLPPQAAGWVWILGGQAALVGAILVVARCLEIRDAQAWALAILLVVNFTPVRINFDNGQINVFLLFLGAVWLWGHARGGHWAGGLALALASALKLLQAPLYLLYLRNRAWPAALAGIAVMLPLFSLAGPGLTVEYVTRILPQIAGSSGFRDNSAPAGSLQRLFHPESVASPSSASPDRLVALLTLVVAIAVVVLVGLAISRLRGRDRRTRLLEAALATSALPLLSTLTWSWHLVLELIPIAIVVCLGWESRRWPPVMLALAGWALLGPLHDLFLTGIVSGLNSEAYLRLGAEAGALGLWVILAASLLLARGWQPAGLGGPVVERGLDVVAGPKDAAHLD